MYSYVSTYDQPSSFHQFIYPKKIRKKKVLVHTRNQGTDDLNENSGTYCLG